MTTLISRFRGPRGQAHLIDALLKQPIVGGDLKIARLLAAQGKLVSFAREKEFIKQGASDYCLYMVLMGTAAIHLNHRFYLDRGEGTHVGEMSLIDVSQCRSASVKAKEPMVALKIPEPVFGAIANKFPQMWRCIAVELGNRLRQRNTLLRARNDRPVVFIGSSSEGLPEANAIEKGLPGLPDLEVQVWNMHTFRPSRATFKTLSDTAERCDFAIMVLRGDDLTVSRGSKSLSPRDNVIFELGLFAGALGVERTFIVHRRKRRPSRSGGKPDLGIKLPSDLAGITTVTYNDGPATTLAARLASVCAQIKQEIDDQGVR